ncbi:transposase [Ekhidna sp.]|jgi:putative transposase|uniref:REP-associated tyrosine transposase n=1 Tax=Ekhidna sp. TaxID=2608089 RepID=UPI0032F00ABE
MSELRKANTDATYFLTFTVVGWIDVFTRSRYCDIIIDSLKFCSENKGLDVFSYVIMPSHIHMLARHEEGKLNEIIRDFKSYTAKEIIRTIDQEQGESRMEWLLEMFREYASTQKQNKVYQFWQKTSHPIEMLSSEMIDQKQEYIHNNPVAAGLVNDPESWVYSSANVMSPLKVLVA